MPDDLRARLSAAFLAALGARPSQRQRRDAAAVLRELAERQEALAGAEARNAATGGQLAPRASTGGRPRGSGARFLRYEPASGTARSGRLHIGRALWQELGEPERLNIQRIGAQLHLWPAEHDAGYAVTSAGAGAGMPRFSIGEGVALDLGLEERRYDATVAAGRIVAEVP